MRQALLGEDSTNEHKLQYVVEVKYQAEGSADRLDADEQYKTNKLLHGMAFEYVGREKNGTTPVTIRFFVDHDTYHALPPASFKNPLKLDDPGLPENLARDIRTYMNVRRAKAGEDFQAGSEKLSKLTLSMYAAKKFAIEKQDRTWFMVGDAAMGVPYFRALNSGIIIASQLAYILTRKSLSNTNKARAYNACRPLDVAWEFTAARSKDIGLNLYSKFRQVSAAVPWSFIKWKEPEAKQFETSHHRAFRPGDDPEP